MQKPIRAVVLAAFAGVWVLAPASGRAFTCDRLIGSQCSGGGYMSCTWSDGTPDTLVCFQRSWHVA